MVAFMLLTASALVTWAILSMRTVAISGRLSRPEKMAGVTFVVITYALAIGITQAIQAL